MSRQEAVEALLSQAQRHVELADLLFSNKKYDFCLFFWHLIIEKTLKAVILSKNKDLLYVHDLQKLSKIAEVKISDQNYKDLARITEFNIEARYDDAKEAFYKLATHEYAKIWMAKSRSIYELLKSQL